MAERIPKMNSEAKLTKNPRIEKILNLILQIASGNLDARETPSELGDELDGIITGLKMLAEELSASTVSRDYVENILKSMIDILIVVNSDATIRTVNQAACDVLGYRKEELVGQPIGMIIEEEEEEEKELFKGTGLKKLIKKGFISNVETAYKTKDGTKIPVLFSGSVMRDENNKILGIVCVARDITERRRAEGKLREEQNKLKVLFDILPVGISVLDAERRIIFVNPALERILGVSKEGLFRGDYKSRTYLRPDGTPMPAEEYASVRAVNEQKTVNNVETGVVKEDGSIIWTDVSAVPVKFPDWHVVIVTSDITERKQAEEALRESEAKVRALFDQTFQFIGMMTTDGTLIEANRTAMQFAGINESDCLGKPFWDTPWWTHSAEMQNKLREAVMKAASGEVVRFDATHPAADGSIHYVDFSLKPVKDKNGKVIFLIPEGRDITERKRAEEELKKAKEYTENIISDMIDSLIVVDSQARIMTINEATEKLLGYTREELIGQPIGMIFEEEEEEEEEEFKGTGLKRLIKKGFIRNQEMIYKTKRGASIPVLFSGSVMRDEKRKIQGIVCLAHDITELKELQEELVKAGKMTVVGELGAGVAHQLNNPLGAIIGFAQLLLKDISSHDSKYDDLKKIEQAGLRCKRIIESLLRFARPGEAMIKRVSVNKLVKDTVFLFEQQIKARTNIKISTDLPRFIPRIFGNPTQLEQVFFNMLSNAQNALPRGGKIRISTKMDRAKGNVMIIFEDNGIGIADRDLYNIFKPFYTLKRAPESVGLGLTLSVRIVESHKGSIDVESILGKGTRFTINLPI